MKFLISSGLSNRQIEYHISPIIKLKEVDKIIIVRDKKGPTLKKVEYYTPPAWSLKSSILKTTFKLFILVFLSIKENPNLIHGYLLFPDGIIAFLSGKFTFKRIGVSLVAGPVEFFILGTSPIEKYAYTKPLPKIYKIGKFLRIILKNFDIITVTGSFTKRFLMKNNIPNTKIFIMPSAVGNRFKPLNVPKEFDVIHVGRLAKVKHIENLIMATNKIKKYYPNVKTAIIGDGPERDNLEAISERLRLTENIHFLGYKSAVWKWLNKAKIFVLTSEREAYPYVVVEALSCGVPVIAAKCGDIKDIMRNNHDGIFVNDYKDVDAFANAILKLLKNPQLIYRYSVNAEKTGKSMTEEKVTSIWENIIYKIQERKI